VTRTYGSMGLDTVKQRWVIDALEPHVAIRLKQLFPSIPKGTAAPFWLNRSPVTDADLDWFTSRYPFRMSDADLQAMKNGRLGFEQMQAEMGRIMLPGYEPPVVTGLREGQVIRQYQVQAIEVLRRRQMLLLGDEGGLGKTYTAAGFLCTVPEALPAAVVCDAHMTAQWKEKIEAFTHLRVHIIKKTKPYDLPPADVYVFGIGKVHGWADIFATGFFKAAVYDEPQSLRAGTETAKGKACAVLSANVSYRLGLTATPVYNYGDEMWRIMHFIDPVVLGDWWDFIREWCTPIGNGKYRINEPKALGSFLREQFAMIRRLKSDVGQELPKVSRIVEHVDYDRKEVERVEDLAHQLAIKATTGTFIERGSAARDLDIMMRHATGVAKAATVAMFTRMLVEAGEPVVLWGWHREVYEIWNRELADLHPAMYTGTESVTGKGRSKDAFLAGETNLLIMSLRSGAGVDGLQYRSSTGVFGELDWSPGIHQQCIWRLDREGQVNPVTAFFLVTDDGSDPPMMDVLGIKASEAQQIVDPHLGAQLVDTDTTNLRRLVDRYLKKKRGAV